MMSKTQLKSSEAFSMAKLEFWVVDVAEDSKMMSECRKNNLRSSLEKFLRRPCCPNVKDASLTMLYTMRLLLEEITCPWPHM